MEYRKIIRANSVPAAIASGIVLVFMAIPAATMAPGPSLLLTILPSKPEIKSKSELRFGRRREKQMDQRVKEFFLRYERANSSSVVSEIGALYADTFMFGGPNGVQAVNKVDFLKVVPKRKAYFSSMGLSVTQLESTEATPLDSKYLLAKVAWKMKLQNSSAMTLHTYATYLLVRGNGDALSIVFQIDHQDLASAVKELQGTQQ